VLLALPRDEAKLKGLAEARRGVTVGPHHKAPEAGPLDDEYLKVIAKLHAAFDSSGLLAGEGEYLPHAVKAFIKVRARSLSPGAVNVFNGGALAFRRIRMAGPGGGVFESGATPEGDPMGALLTSLKKLQSLKAGGLDDEENVQDELSTARKSLKAIGITADTTPPALRRRVLHLIRAVALGEAYPEPAVATEEQAKQFRALVAELGHESIENREKAMKELSRAGEASLPFLREALKSGDAEIVTRSKALLGVGHAPWKTVASPQDNMEQTIEVLIAPPPVVDPPKPK
jgi:hypothetical protein